MEKIDAYSDRVAVEELFRKYYKILRAYAYRLSGDKNTAEDIVQEVYYELWKNKDNLTLENTIKYYLFRSVYTKTLNYLNSKEYTNKEPFENSTEGRIQRIYMESQWSDQETDLIYKELQNRINSIIDSLPEQCKKVFLLSRKQELRNKEIAELLNISIKTVEKHISKALSILRQQVKSSGLLLLLPLFLQS